MASRKLSDADKQQILELYRSSSETAASLSNRYGVSNSTISRLLKTELPEAEYEALIQQKRGRSSVEVAVIEPSLPPIEVQPVPEIPEPAPPEPSIAPPVQLASETPSRRVRKRSSTVAAQNEGEHEGEPAMEPPAIKAKPEAKIEPAAVPESKPQLPSIPAISLQTEAPAGEDLPPAPPLPLPVPKTRLVIGAPKVVSLPQPVLSNGFAEGNSVLEEILDEEIVEDDDLEDDLGEDDLDDLDDEDGEDDDGDNEPLEEGALLMNRQGKGNVRIQVLPLTDASIPRTCYLVVDRSAELVARPLKEFGDLGSIPDEETLAKTLPVFDNHRVAKRYANPRTQRVIKLPDGKVLQRTSSHLQAKGITRLLIDGQIYSIAGED